MKKLFLLLAVLFINTVTSQEKVSIQFTQDARLAILGDGKSYDAGTLDFTASFQLQGNQQEWGYMVVYPEFEYAELEIAPYKRWTVNVGYTLNKLILDDLEMGASLSYGWIDRGLSDFCWGANAFTKYKFNDTIKVVANLQLTERPDLEIIYGDKGVWRISGHLGIEISVFNQKGRY